VLLDELEDDDGLFELLVFLSSVLVSLAVDVSGTARARAASARARMSDVKVNGERAVVGLLGAATVAPPELSLRRNDAIHPDLPSGPLTFFHSRPPASRASDDTSVIDVPSGYEPTCVPPGLSRMTPFSPPVFTI